MAFIVVRGKNEPAFIPTVERYLYDGQSVVSEPVENWFGSAMVVVDTGNETGPGIAYRDQYLADRFTSGNFGAKLFVTREEADAYIESERTTD
jgi:hypothetical protein